MELDSGNIAWMLTASALVLFMTPGLGFFYGGLTRNKNVLATIMQSFITTGVVAILWVWQDWSTWPWWERIWRLAVVIGAGATTYIALLWLQGIRPRHLRH